MLPYAETAETLVKNLTDSFESDLTHQEHRHRIQPPPLPYSTHRTMSLSGGYAGHGSSSLKDVKLTKYDQPSQNSDEGISDRFDLGSDELSISALLGIAPRKRKALMSSEAWIWMLKEVSRQRPIR